MNLEPNLSPSLQQFEFDIVTVNAQGHIHTATPQQFTSQVNSQSGSQLEASSWLNHLLYPQSVAFPKGQAVYFREELEQEIVLDMVRVMEGVLMMGYVEEEQHAPVQEWTSVTIAPFWVSKFPVTQAQYEAIMGYNPSYFQGAHRPVERVSWEEATRFCQKLSRRTHRTYRLLSEAEWEYVGRARTTTLFHFGETITPHLANYRTKPWHYNEPTKPGFYEDGEVVSSFRGQTTNVGCFPPNAFGLYDVHGNVWEWCQDHWRDSCKNLPLDGSAAQGGGKFRAIRGGSWQDSPWNCNSVNRKQCEYYLKDNTLGFRVACVEPA